MEEDVDWDCMAVCLISGILECSSCIGFSNSWLLNTFGQPEIFRYPRELRLNMLLGRLTRLMQFFKFKKASFLRSPTDGWIRARFVHPSRIIHSRLGTPLKSGTLIRFLESLRSKALKFGRCCKIPIQEIATYHVFFNISSKR